MAAISIVQIVFMILTIVFLGVGVISFIEKKFENAIFSLYGMGMSVIGTLLIAFGF